jgi:hypothetical protein
LALQIASIHRSSTSGCERPPFFLAKGGLLPAREGTSGTGKSLVPTCTWTEEVTPASGSRMKHLRYSSTPSTHHSDARSGPQVS